MEEKNELNDIILSKGGSNSNSKKMLLAIAALTLILIIVLVIMNSLKTQSDAQPPVAAVPPTPTSPKEIVNDPLFEPVKVIQEGEGNQSSETIPAVNEAPAKQQDLGQIAQKIKQESMQNTPAAAAHVVQAAPTQQSVPAQQPKTVSVPAAAPAPAPVKVTTKAAPVTAQKTEKPVVNTPTIKTTKPTEVKKEAEPKKVTASKATTETPAPKTGEKAAVDAAPKPEAAETSAPKTSAKAEDSGVWYIQVGSFAKEPNKALFDRLNASGLKYTTVPAGATTKVMVGPFQGKKAAQDVLGNVKRNIEAGAYPTPAQK
ncbi:MAG: SPOR domain-containing protein [Sulfuricurvum sp.]|uniref:SPOR domain-containing protein n=1 Tax=Sulfuricurvum sp. TaxID=2025608 RepID=UPI0025D5CC38|nr:SPOR domain-containing protein [Sulfuricurvum sp.]MCI4405891.1 SPOR domain-containing protein [Sulfuricurvum sp.]